MEVASEKEWTGSKDQDKGHLGSDQQANKGDRKEERRKKKLCLLVPSLRKEGRPKGVAWWVYSECTEHTVSGKKNYIIASKG